MDYNHIFDGVKSPAIRYKMSQAHLKFNVIVCHLTSELTFDAH